ncbi:hypothetical protein PIB30_047008 [Stylosanthes scabra]|uniref:Uncharacterized protein n=1 Tax=Stylosanthes scabra TaxID=79078 RepID=A0ABU6YFG2_9FABA|nr:hypothetical protein [Stylosanthes scabra]
MEKTILQKVPHVDYAQTQRRPIQRGMPNFHLIMFGMPRWMGRLCVWRNLHERRLLQNGFLRDCAFGVGAFCIEGASRFNVDGAPPSQLLQKQTSCHLGKTGATVARFGNAVALKKRLSSLCSQKATDRELLYNRLIK